MKPDLKPKIIITDATTGIHLKTININDWSQNTLEYMFIDIINKDLYKNQNGLLIKYGV